MTMAVNQHMPGIFTTEPSDYKAHTEKSERTHARPAFINNEYGYPDPAVGLFAGKKFLGIVHLDDAERLINEIRFSIGEHPGSEHETA